MMHTLKKIVLNTEKQITSFVVKIIGAIFCIIRVVCYFPSAIKESFNPSYYPEYDRKSTLKRIMENLWWTIRHQRYNGFYNLYGMDCKRLPSGQQISEYIDEKEFWSGLDKLNYSKGYNSQCFLLRDKYQFYEYLTANNIPTPKVFAVLDGDQLFDETLQPIAWESIRTKEDYFIKDIAGECASFVRHIHNYNDLLEMKSILKGKYILQEAITQHPEMARLNPSAINTLRIITLYNHGTPEVLSVLLRVGTQRTGSVDNWAAGGFAIGVQKNGFLKKYGFYKPGHGTKESMHPDTNVIFNQFQIPWFDEAIAAALKAHRYFYTIGAIGWDIAISENGPVFIEGNDNFEITLMQAVDGGLKKKWRSYI